MPDTIDPSAPHGRDEHGNPLAPFGYTLDGRVKKDNRGAPQGRKSGARTTRTPRKRSASPSVTSTSRRDAQRREALLSLTEMFVVMPLAAMSAAPPIKTRLGKHADALGGDAVIISHYSPAVADSLIVLSQTKPGVLTWLDRMDEKAPYLMLANVGIQITKALVSNHMNPNPDLNAAGRTLAASRAAQMVETINAEAAANGIQPEDVAA